MSSDRRPADRPADRPAEPPGRVLLASRAAPTSDPTAGAGAASAVATLPLGDRAESARRLRAHSDGLVLVAVPPHERPLLRGVVGGLAGGSRLDVAVLDAPVGSLSGRVFAALVGEVGARCGIDAALTMAEGLGRHLVSQVLVSSLSRLNDPAPGFWLSLRSLVPGGRYAVCTGAVDAVQSPPVRPDPREPDPREPDPPGLEPLAIGLTARADTWMDQVLADLAPEVPRLPVWDSVTQFGNRYWAEIVWWQPAGVAALTRRAESVMLPRCRWCRCPHAREVCEFCGFVDPGPPRPTQPAAKRALPAQAQDRAVGAAAAAVKQEASTG